MFLTANLYNSACSNAVNPIRIHPIMMSIILHHYKMLKERTSSFGGPDNSSDDDNNNDIYDYNNIDSTILIDHSLTIEGRYFKLTSRPYPEIL